MTIQVNLILGSLGAGKTTLLRHFLSQKPADENWMLLINEFGSLGIDGAILESSGQTEVELVPGGCICCTAQGELRETLTQISQRTDLHRLLIEPTGLGEPDVLVDLFVSLDLKQHFEVNSLFSVFDLTQIELEELKRLSIMKSLLNMADVLIFNKTDLVSQHKINEIKTFCEALYPPKEQVHFTQQAAISINLLNHPHFQPMLFFPQTDSTPTTAHCAVSLSMPTTEQPFLLERKTNQGHQTLTFGWLFSPEAVFDWPKLQSLFNDLAQQPTVKRAKGVFCVGKPWMLFQMAAQQTSREFIAYRKDSRIELLIEQNASFNLEQFERKLVACQKN